MRRAIRHMSFMWFSHFEATGKGSVVAIMAAGSNEMQKYDIPLPSRPEINNPEYDFNRLSSPLPEMLELYLDIDAHLASTSIRTAIEALNLTFSQSYDNWCPYCGAFIEIWNDFEKKPNGKQRTSSLHHQQVLQLPTFKAVGFDLLCFALLCYALLCFALHLKKYFALHCFALHCFSMLCFGLIFASGNTMK